MFYSSQANKTQRVGITKVHLPTGFSWKTLKKEKTNDAVIIELKKDVQFSPQVRTGHCCLSFQVLPICLPTAVCGHMQDALFHIFSLVTVNEVLYEPNISFRELRLKRVKS